jgi:hypothetical protein
MHRSSEFHRARQAPCRSVRLPGRTDPAGPRFLRSKTNSETCVTIRIRQRTPFIVGRRPRHRYDLCRKYRECRKIPVDRTRHVKERALSFLSLFRRQCPAVAGAGSKRHINGLAGLPEKRSERDPVRRSADQIRCEEIPVQCPIASVASARSSGVTNSLRRRAASPIARRLDSTASGTDSSSPATTGRIHGT